MGVGRFWVMGLRGARRVRRESMVVVVVVTIWMLGEDCCREV